MKITPIRTNKITSKSHTQETLCDTYIHQMKENSIVVVTSKIVSLCEGSVVSNIGKTRNELAEQLTDSFIPASQNKYNYMITIKNNKLIASAGIDNGDNQFILWPKDAQLSANKIREHLTNARKLKNVGIIIADTKSVPFMRGTIGFALAHSGFLALNDYRGKKDIFGGTMCSTVVNVAEALATSAVLVMGEGDEQQPFAIIEDIPFVEFQDRNPNKKEMDLLNIKMENDLFAPLLLSAPWQNRK
jgi:F420-0:gamma-glutamyl ligase